MNYQTLSPSACAAQLVVEILNSIPECPSELKTRIEDLARQQARMIFEHCAMIAEDYVANNDRDGKASGLEIGDCIAEEIRQSAEERKTDRTLMAMRIKQLE